MANILAVIISCVIGYVLTFIYLTIGKEVVKGVNKVDCVSYLATRIPWLVRFMRLLLLIFWPLITPVVLFIAIIAIVYITFTGVTKLLTDISKAIRGE